MAVRENVTLDEAVELLNEAARLDPEGMYRLIMAKVPCNQALADHPTIQVREEMGKFEFGALGLINGLFGIRDNGWGAIIAEVDGDCNTGRVTKFRRSVDT